VIDILNSIESDAAAIDTLYFELKPLLRVRERGIFFPVHTVQAVRIDKDENNIIIEIFLETIEIWIKITREYVDAHIYPLFQCDCSG
jgi:hypothetical protein